MRLDHQERTGCGKTEAATKVRKTSSKEKIKAQDTSEIGTEIEDMHEKNRRGQSGNGV